MNRQIVFSLFTALLLGCTGSALAGSIFDLELAQTPLLPEGTLRARLAPSGASDAVASRPNLVSRPPVTYVIPKWRRVPVAQQDDCSSSEAWVVAQMATNILWQSPDLRRKFVTSPTFLFRDVGKRSCGGGWNLADAVGASRSRPLRMDYVGMFDVPGVPTRSLAVRSSGSLQSKDLMRQFLASNIPLGASLAAFPGINRYRGGVYVEDKARAALYGTLDATPAGRHTVMVIGYHRGGPLRTRDFFQQLVGSSPPYLPETVELPAFWVYQNSWGTEWGLSGYGLIAAGEPRSGPIDTKMWWIGEVELR